MAEFRIEWDHVARRDWHKLLLQAPRCGLQQGWSYGEALRAGGVALRRLVARGPDGRPLACAQVAQRRLMGLVGTAFLLRGPVWLDRDVPTAAQEALIRQIRADLGRPILIWAPESTATPPGRRPVVTGYSTIWLDLAQPLVDLERRLDAKWRGHLRQARRGALEVARQGTGAGLDWLIAANEAYRRNVGYRGPAPLFLRRLAAAAETSGELFCLVARERGAPVAGILVLRHGAAATYEVGHTTPRGRELRAKFLLLWRAVELLAAQRVRWLDLGGIDTERARGVARFKLGLGGEVETLAGTFTVMR